MAKDKGGNVVVPGNKVIIPIACPVNAMGGTKVSVIKPSLPSMMVVKSNTVCKLGSGALQLKPPLFPSLTHWWKCNELSGNRADYKGGLTANQIITLGSNEGAADFFTNRFGLLRTIAFAMPQPFTVALWFKAAALTSDGSILFSKTDSTGNSFYINWATSGPDSLLNIIQDDAQDQLIAQPNLGAWHYVVYTSDNNTVALYVDGVNTDGGDGAVLGLDGPVRIGVELPDPHS